MSGEAAVKWHERSASGSSCVGPASQLSAAMVCAFTRAAVHGRGAMQDRLQLRPERWLTWGCSDGKPPARDPAGLRPLHHDRVHDPRRAGQPITWPVTPYYRAGRRLHRRDDRARLPEEGARRAGATRKVALLFSDPTGSGIDDRRRCSSRAPPTSTTATSTPTASATRASRSRSCPRPRSMLPPKPLRRMFGWYFTRIYVHVRPERVYVWPGGDVDARARAVRRPHGGGPLRPRRGAGRGPPEPPRAAPRRGTRAWTSSASATRTAVLSLVAPDGFPFSVRLPIGVDRGAPPHPAGRRAARRALPARASPA